MCQFGGAKRKVRHFGRRRPLRASLKKSINEKKLYPHNDPHLPMTSAAMSTSTSDHATEDEEIAAELAQATLMSEKSVQQEQPVFEFVHNKMARKTTKWIASLLKKILDPNGGYLNVIDGTEFLKQQAIVMSLAMQEAESNAPSVMLEAKRYGNTKHRLQARRQGRTEPRAFTEKQLSLVSRASNANSYVAVRYVTEQWQRCAANSLFMALVERETVAECDQKDDVKADPAFHTSASGYHGSFDEHKYAKMTKVTEKVAYKIRHAQLGRLFRWALLLRREWETAMDRAASVPLEILYSPIYTTMSLVQADDLTSVIEFFVRAKYAATTLQLDRFLSQQKSSASGETLTTSVMQKYFDVRLALCEADGCKTSAAGLHSGATQQRNAIQLHDATQFLSLLDVTETQGSPLGNAETALESARCLWTIWLQNLHILYTLAHKRNVLCVSGSEASTESETDDTDFAKKIAANMTEIMLTLVTMPKMQNLTVLLTSVEKFVVQQQYFLLQKYGFDLDACGLVQRVRRRLNALAQVALFYESYVLQGYRVNQAVEQLTAKLQVAAEK